MASQYSSKAGWNSGVRYSATVGVYAWPPGTVRAVIHALRSRPLRSVLSLLAAGSLVLVLAGCGDDKPSDTGSGAPQGDATLVAKDIQWDQDTLTAPAGQDFTIVVDNQ